MKETITELESKLSQSEKRVEELDKQLNELAIEHGKYAERMQSKLSEALELIKEVESALKMYGKNSGVTYWRLGGDKYGVTCEFDWDGNLQDEAWEIAEKALSSIATFRKSGGA